MMRSLSILVLLSGIYLPCSGQFNQHQRIAEPPRDSLSQSRAIDVPAEFEGGMAKFYEFVGKQLRYPKDARKRGIEGKVIVEFVIEKDGSIPPDSVKVLRGLCEPCNREAVRVVRAMPKWKPARSGKSNEPVPQRYTLPIFFKL